jgi:hypothetical protein
VAVYSSDFQGAGTFEPVDPPLFLGIEPLLLALLVVLGAILFWLGWQLRSNQTARDTDAAERIWKAIDDALKTAMKADGSALVGRAEEVERTIRRNLGATLAIGKGLCAGLKSLNAALDGHRPGHHDSHSDPHPEHDDTEHTDEAGDHTESAHSGAVTQITVVNGVREGGTSGRHPAGSGHSGSGHHGGGHGAHLTPRERDHALRAAIADLNDYWRLKSERIGEMREAHRELSAD